MATLDISLDNLCEPQDLWTSRVEPKFRDRLHGIVRRRKMTPTGGSATASRAKVAGAGARRAGGLRAEKLRLRIE